MPHFCERLTTLEFVWLRACCPCTLLFFNVAIKRTVYYVVL